jgi:DNA-binding NtrC family response regulator
MQEASILIVGPPSQLRDSYELSVRRHTTDVRICENCRSAHVWLSSAEVRAVIVLAGDKGRQVEEFLASLRCELPHVPVFFMGNGFSESSASPLLFQGTVLLPPDMPATQFEQILFPAPAPAPDAAQTDEGAIALERRQFPVHFARAKALFETEFLTRVLKREHGNIARAARTIGMARRNLQIKIQAHQIDITRIRHRT